MGSASSVSASCLSVLLQAVVGDLAVWFGFQTATFPRRAQLGEGKATGDQVFGRYLFREGGSHERQETMNGGKPGASQHHRRLSYIPFDYGPGSDCHAPATAIGLRVIYACVVLPVAGSLGLRARKRCLRPPRYGLPTRVQGTLEYASPYGSWPGSL